jgi:hypothetical protein
VFQHYFQSGPSANMATGYGGTQLTIEWTNQHGCGGNEDTDPQKQNCNMVLQYMCEDAIENIPGMYFKLYLFMLYFVYVLLLLLLFRLLHQM